MDRRLRDPVSVAVLVLVVTGVALRVWVLVANVGVLDADSAVPGLIAIHFRHGDARAFYWGQHYGGTLESMIGAAVLLVMRPSPALIKVIPMAFSAAASVGTWWLGRSFLPERAARLGAAVMWAAPASLIWYSSKAGGSYWSGLALSVIGVALVVRVAQSPSPTGAHATIAGLVTGLAWWTNPQLLYIALPIAFVVVAPLLRQRRAIGFLAIGFLVGALPWLWHNVASGWPSLHPPPQQTTAPNGYIDHLRVFGKLQLPMALGLRGAFTTSWVLGVVGKALYLLVLLAGAAFVVVARRRHVALRLMLVALPLVYAIWTFSWFAAFPRYATYFLPALSLALALAFTARSWAVLPATAAVVALSMTGMSTLSGVSTGPAGPDVPLASMGPLIRSLEQLDVKHAYANYWIAYRLTYESNERVVLTDPASVRYPPYDRAVRADPHAAYVFAAGSKLVTRFHDVARRLGVQYEEARPRGYVIARLATPVAPEQFAEVWAP
jgi:hypothetical protein